MPAIPVGLCGWLQWWRPAWEPGATRRAPLVGNDFSSYHKGLQDQERCLPPPSKKRREQGAGLVTQHSGVEGGMVSS